uniref:Plastocyanin-like domain-containing protein n=1 Tax=Magallana gigas TaxID=29159 RepID=A0A8W8NZN9_MAGGI
MGFPSVNETGFLIPNNDIQCSPTLANNKSQCNNATWRNATWNDYRSIPNINVEDPVRKDTIVVPYGGYSIIRIWATNPGVWFMHCHIDRHMVEGMALMLNESFENIGDLPIGLQTCHNFKNQPSAPKSFFQASEENISEMSSATIGLIVTSVILFLALVILSLILLRTCRKLGEPGQSMNLPMSSISGRE